MTYDRIKYTISDISEGIEYDVSALSNIASLLYSEIENVNWVGFYLLRDGKLILGPFQGKLACTEIELGKGVCGKAAEKNHPIFVHDVHTYEGHITCDSESNSEVVLPIHKNGQLYGVLDIDSPLHGRFNGCNQDGFIEIAEEISKVLSKTKA